MLEVTKIGSNNGKFFMNNDLNFKFCHKNQILAIVINLTFSVIMSTNLQENTEKKNNHLSPSEKNETNSKVCKFEMPHISKLSVILQRDSSIEKLASLSIEEAKKNPSPQKSATEIEFDSAVQQFNLKNMKDDSEKLVSTCFLFYFLGNLKIVVDYKMI